MAARRPLTLVSGTVQEIPTGDTFAQLVQTTVALTDGATISTDASLGNVFTVTLGGNRTMAVPTNPSAGQTIIYQITQDATGGRTLTWTSSGAGSFGFGTDITAPTLSTGAGKIDYVGFFYAGAVSKWHCMGAIRGY